MLNFNSILLSTENQKKLKDFYKEVFQKDPEMDEDKYTGFLVGTCFFSIGFHDKIHGKSPNPERILFNFETDNVKEEFERIKGIEGASVIAEPYSMGDDQHYWIATLSDPDGNYFQLVTPWESK